MTITPEQAIAALRAELDKARQRRAKGAELLAATRDLLRGFETELRKLDDALEVREAAIAHLERAAATVDVPLIRPGASLRSVPVPPVRRES